MPAHSSRQTARTPPPPVRDASTQKKKEASCRDAAPTQSYIDRCIELISRAGLRVTGPRRAVVSFLATSEYPITIAELHDALGEPELGDCLNRGEQLSKVSLYRVIADLERIHLLHRVHPSGGYVLCAHVGCADHSHVIITCQQCNETSEMTVPSEYLGPLMFFLKSSGAHLSDPPILRVEGLCRECCA